MNVLEVKQLQIMREQRVIIDNLSFELPEGYRLFLQGDIGCGKSTLLHCLLGFIPYQQGEIRWFDNTAVKKKILYRYVERLVSVSNMQAINFLVQPYLMMWRLVHSIKD